MPPERTAQKKQERETLSLRIKTSGYTMPPDSKCAPCLRHGRRCIVLPRDSGRCSECVWRGFSCDAGVRGVSASDWSSLEKEEQRIRAEKKATLAKLLRLERQEEFLRERGMKMLRRGLSSLDELDAVESVERAAVEDFEREREVASHQPFSSPAPLDPMSFADIDPNDPLWANLGFPESASTGDPPPPDTTPHPSWAASSGPSLVSASDSGGTHSKVPDS